RASRPVVPARPTPRGLRRRPEPPRRRRRELATAHLTTPTARRTPRRPRRRDPPAPYCPDRPARAAAAAPPPRPLPQAGPGLPGPDPEPSSFHEIAPTRLRGRRWPPVLAASFDRDQPSRTEASSA